MSDIFEIKGVNAELVVNQKHYKFADPKFKEKVLLQKEMKALGEKKASMDEVDYAMAQYEVSKKMIKQYLPTLEDAVLDDMGDNAVLALLDQLTKLSEQKFGAVVEKVEKK